MYREPPAQDSLVIASLGNVVTAYARQTGELVWRHDMDDQGAPHLVTVRFTIAEHRVIAFAGGPMESAWSANVAPTVTCLDYATGRTQWTVELPALATNWGRIEGTLLVDRGQVLLATRAALVALSLATGEVQWSRSLVGASKGDHRSVALGIPGHIEHSDRR